MNDGSRVLMTSNPLIVPTMIANPKAIITDSQMGRPSRVTHMPMVTPAKPTIEPSDRSNSPADH